MEKSFYYVLPFLAIILILTSQKCCTAQPFTNLDTDQSSLLEMKAHIISDPSLTITTNWSNSSSVCSWIGVTCGSRHRRVTALNLSDMGLLGSIPPQLGNLTFLVSLELTRNNFSGTLPQEMSRLRRLKFLSIRENNFRGEIPSWLPFLPKLEYLSLRSNSFSGFIPKSISNLTNLYHLDFSFNSLEGIIPPEIGRLQRLQLLAIQSNNLTGIIPSAIFNMSSLQRLAFRANGLSGNLPNDLCANLPFIQGIYLAINQLSGLIPSNLSQCSQLQLLSLDINSFSGQIPAAIGDLKSLQVLQLSRNQLTGTLPLSIFNISSLQILDLSRNNLYGNLSKDVGNLTMLTDLYLAVNNFTGVLPREIGQRLQHLERLQLATNLFSGSLPPEIFNISTLQLLVVTQNDLSGSLPTNLCSGLPFLEVLYLGGNHFSGIIPESISNCSQLKQLDIGSNKFTGLVPHSLGSLKFLQILNLPENNLTFGSSSEVSFITSLTNCRSLEVFGINGNPLDATLPSSTGNLSSHLQQFIAFDCGLKGRIPAEIGNLTSLVRLDLYGNDLFGNIPLTVKHLIKLQGLDLANNNITGIIPDDLCDLHSLSELSLSGNQLSGAIPKCLGDVTSLRHLFLNSNMLTSTIPSGLWHLKDLLSLDLSTNSLIRFLPPEFGNLAAAIYINISMNQLSESIPTTIGSLQNLVTLYLSHNRLQGSIPVSIGTITSLQTLDFSYNNLSGSVPKSMVALQHLDNLNVSFNALSGEIPSGGPFLNFTMESFKGNKALCGIPRFDVPPCPVVDNHRSKLKKVKFILFILGGIAVFATIMCFSFIFLRYKRKVKAIDAILSIAPERISYYELSRATQQFNESNLLGTGSFGSVYRGILENGNDIAVKVFKLQSEAAFKSFDVECEVFRNIRHRNLTKVISSCSNEEFKALVLEYMPKGNLEKWLYTHNYCLDFIQRMNIMIDVGSALEYLHHGYSTSIVHCDLKPSNVLLDEEMVAHVSDFGISKLLGDGESVVITNTLATLGYIAPEYGLEGLVSTRCDVYSYGVLLMETFSRKKPSDDMFAGDLSLKVWIASAVPQSTHQVIDANLLLNVNEEHGDKIIKFTSFILELAVKCCAYSPNDRITMKETLVELQKIVRRFLDEA
ncbi:probable LRR receptor-like serine/threonine-protein kinase At3g47570 [Salvia miltiorrhiza]|uniref:probable LRR receptor-like serine/threonine-protein kinase At3g47570 n=1 Tax=Salvia miltiorrhiza TaxID=226208 RepID=UPI0025ABF087|nr:probable LRR receptor-like serine/threonine-protein kinase At3g47570 [Salvia miltiorrhiza]